MGECSWIIRQLNLENVHYHKNKNKNCISIILCTLNIQVLRNLWGNHSQLMHILRETMFKIGMIHILREKCARLEN